MKEIKAFIKINKKGGKTKMNVIYCFRLSKTWRLQEAWPLMEIPHFNGDKKDDAFEWMEVLNEFTLMDNNCYITKKMIRDKSGYDNRFAYVLLKDRDEIRCKENYEDALEILVDFIDHSPLRFYENKIYICGDLKDKIHWLPRQQKNNKESVKNVLLNKYDIAFEETDIMCLTYYTAYELNEVYESRYNDLTSVLWNIPMIEYNGYRKESYDSSPMIYHNSVESFTNLFKKEEGK